MDRYSSYFQAQVKRELCWMVTSSLRYSEHVAFDRAIDKKNSVFEFFVSPDLEDVFLHIMNALEQKGIVSNLKKLPNRLKSES